VSWRRLSQPQRCNLKTAEARGRLRILHVDDDPCILQVSKDILELEGNFEVDTALSVDEAVKKMEEQPYDAVISDYEMPQKNGLQFLKELREKHNKIPFVIFTGKGREEVAIKALNLGADRYLSKTGDPEILYCELAHAIHQAQPQTPTSCGQKARLQALMTSKMLQVIGKLRSQE
jgi:DNA-binding response OmpR family regulator